MTDVRPEAEVETLGHDFTIAKPDDAAFRQAFVQAFEHLFWFS
jgi:hypothetical protein